MSSDAARELRPGDLVGPYRVVVLLGKGGMGQVYEAIGPEGDHVALKIVKPDIARDAVFRRRFEREASIAQRVVHSHVVPVIDVGEHWEIPYLVQRFITGGSLEQRLDQDGTLSLSGSIRIGLWVAAGLHAVHAAGLVHRDVKPGNILLDEEGVAHITDFGLAKDHQATVLTRPGQALGSLDYMAPEQIRGEQVTAATDVYALACVMYTCLSGRPPFADRQGMQVLWAHLQDEPPDIAERRSELPKNLGEAIRFGLQKDPAARPPTATAYARLLQIAAGS